MCTFTQLKWFQKSKKSHSYTPINTTLLLTWTINPKIWNTITYKNSLDPNVRIKEYLKAVYFYVTISDFKNIVFCENSNFNCKEYIDNISYIAKLYNKNFEFIQFMWNHNETITRKTYSYWEWEILDYAFDNSRLLKQSKSRYKITWRYIIYNINDIIKSSEEMENLLFRWLRSLSFFSIDTSFFKVSNEIYKKYLYNTKTLTQKDRCIEKIFYEKLNWENIKFWELNVLPKKDWYRDDWHYEKLYHHIFLKLWFWNIENKIMKFLDKLYNR